MNAQLSSPVMSVPGVVDALPRVVSPILVTGGTGTLGRLVVARLREAGCDVRVLSRRRREGVEEDREGIEFVTGDLATGEGAEAAVDGTGIIVHCAGSSTGDEDKTRHLVRAASRAGARHLVYISVVGADRIPVASGIDRAIFGYFASKLAAERVVADSGLPWTTLRATQFHDLILMTARRMARLPLIPVPAGMRFQPVDAGEVADRLVELALGTPAGLAARPGRSRDPCRREPGPGPGRGPTDLGGLPGRAREAERGRIRVGEAGVRPVADVGHVRDVQRRVEPAPTTTTSTERS